LIEEVTGLKFTRREFLRLAAGGLATTGLLGGGFVYATQIEPGWVEVTSTQVNIIGLAPAFDGFRILHLSDLHVDNRFMNRERLLDLRALIGTLVYDVIVITGDFVTDHTASGVQSLLSELLTSLEAPDGKFAVLGNHDYWTNPAAVRAMLLQSDVIELANRIHTITRGDDRLHVCGVDDVWEGMNDLRVVLSALPPEGTAILLAHEPDFADQAAAARRFALQLSGHSHGGQIRLPLIGAPILPWLGEKYPAGLYEIDGMFQYTSRGVGLLRPALWFPEIRFNCRPEIALITLRRTA